MKDETVSGEREMKVGWKYYCFFILNLEEPFNSLNFQVAKDSHS